MAISAPGISAPSTSLPSSTKSLISQWGLSPFPAWAFSSALLASIAVKPPPILIQSSTTTSTGLFKSSRAITPYPSNAQVLLFSSFVGLGGFMCYDNDPVNGAAVISVWSLLYTCTNFKKSLWNLKIYPKALVSFSLVNTALYGAKYFNFL